MTGDNSIFESKDFQFSAFNPNEEGSNRAVSKETVKNPF